MPTPVRTRCCTAPRSSRSSSRRRADRGRPPVHPGQMIAGRDVQKVTSPTTTRPPASQGTAAIAVEFAAAARVELEHYEKLEGVTADASRARSNPLRDHGARRTLGARVRRRFIACCWLKRPSTTRCPHGRGPHRRSTPRQVAGTVEVEGYQSVGSGLRSSPSRRSRSCTPGRPTPSPALRGRRRERSTTPPTTTPPPADRTWSRASIPRPDGDRRRRRGWRSPRSTSAQPSPRGPQSRSWADTFSPALD